jgi:hypothetical protein
VPFGTSAPGSPATVIFAGLARMLVLLMAAALRDQLPSIVFE